MRGSRRNPAHNHSLKHETGPHLHTGLGMLKSKRPHLRHVMEQHKMSEHNDAIVPVRHDADQADDAQWATDVPRGTLSTLAKPQRDTTR